jgi:hypothetical protein
MTGSGCNSTYELLLAVKKTVDARRKAGHDQQERF